MVSLPTSGGKGPTTEALIYKYSCANLLRDVSMNNEVFITKANPPPPDEVDKLGKVIFPVEREGGRRGSKHRSSRVGDFEGVYKALYACPAVKEVWDAIIKADRVAFCYVIPVLYREGNRKDKSVSFKSHIDIDYPGKPWYRSNWTWYCKTASTRKIFRMQNRISGWWFDVLCEHGTIIEQSKWASGIGVNGMGQGEMEHAVLFASDTITITWDHGRKSQVSKADENAAFEQMEYEYEEDEQEQTEPWEDDNMMGNEEGDEDEGEDDGDSKPKGKPKDDRLY